MGITAAFAGIAVTDFTAMAVGTSGFSVGRRKMLALLVDDLDGEVATIAARGIDMDPIYTIPGKARKAETEDPEGSRVSLGQPISN